MGADYRWFRRLRRVGIPRLYTSVRRSGHNYALLVIYIKSGRQLGTYLFDYNYTTTSRSPNPNESVNIVETDMAKSTRDECSGCKEFRHHLLCQPRMH